MSKNRRNIRIIIWVICGLGLLIFLGVKISEGFKRIKKSFADDLPLTYSIPSEDSIVIAKKYLPKLKANKIVHSRNRGPISLIYFDTVYYLIFYRIDLIKDGPLKEVLHTDIESVDRTTGTVYTVINHNNFFQFQFQAGPANPVSNIYLTLAGDSLKNLVENDSVMSYHLLCKNLSIRYTENGPIDLFVVGQEGMLASTAIIPMDLVFLDRDGAVYLLIMTPNDPKSTIAPDLLYNVVMGI
jgi:hypothetical protein